LIIKGI
nr:Chain A, TAR DNA-binding protein 43 [Homo sapiens]5W50_B Chain B, TAR DNA-binding protein 43 [Homo sapiens]